MKIQTLAEGFRKKQRRLVTDLKPACLAGSGEAFWFCLSLLLFLLLGPFSAVVVIIGLFSLAGEENRSRMAEPAPR